MEANIKRYNVVIHGRVQNTGFRDLVTQMAIFLRLKGYIFNDIDGSVKLIVEGAKDALDSFLEDIRIKTRSIGAEVEVVDKREVSLDTDLPPKFVKIPTTELEEIGSKLDIGVGKLISIDSKLDKIDGKLDKLDGKLDKLDAIVEGQGKMLKVLEKIERKL